MKIDRLNMQVMIGNKTVQPSLVRVEQYAATLPYCEVVLSCEHRQRLSMGAAISVSIDSVEIFNAYLQVSSAIHGGTMHKCGHNLKPSVVNVRNEKAPYIFDALADQAGVNEWAGDVPFIEFPHFHCDGDGWTNLLAFAESLSDWSDDSFDVYFNSKGILNLHPITQNGVISTEFNRGENALLITDKTVKAFPVPVGYGQSIQVNGHPQRIVGLRYLITPRNSIMEVMF